MKQGIRFLKERLFGKSKYSHVNLDSEKASKLLVECGAVDSMQDGRSIIPELIAHVNLDYHSGLFLHRYLEFERIGTLRGSSGIRISESADFYSFS